MMKLYPAGTDPALALYSVWEMLAEPHLNAWQNWLQRGGEPPRVAPLQTEPFWTRESPLPHYWTGIQFPWARQNWYVVADTLDIFGKPVFKYGWRSGRGHFIPAFILDSKGRFQVSIRSWGTRHALAAGTFLAYGWDASRYRWYIPSDPGSSGQWDEVRNWRNPIHSVNEPTLQLGAWKQLLTWDQHEYKIHVSEWACQPGDNGSDGHDHASCGRRAYASRLSMENNDRLLARRYRLQENRERRAQGLAPTSNRTATLRDGNQTLTVPESIAVLTALMEVEAPAKTGTRLTEAQEEITA